MTLSISGRGGHPPRPDAFRPHVAGGMESRGSTEVIPYLGQIPRAVDILAASAPTVEWRHFSLDPRRLNRDAPPYLFAYGTLAPDGPEAAARGGWTADRVRGRLYDLGPYPALVDCEEPGVGWVDGYVRSIDTDGSLRRLDAYEGVEEGLYRRVAVTTQAGRAVWVYVYARPLPPSVRGPLARWNGPRLADRS